MINKVLSTLSMLRKSDKSDELNTEDHIQKEVIASTIIERNMTRFDEILLELQLMSSHWRNTEKANLLCNEALELWVAGANPNADIMEISEYNHSCRMSDITKEHSRFPQSTMGV
jgi:hypothetical protein